MAPTKTGEKGLDSEVELRWLALQLTSRYSAFDGNDSVFGGGGYRVL